MAAPFQLLELNVISAQDLASMGRNMRTYAVAWVHPDRKLSTKIDTEGHTNPTWNDKFVFRVDDQFLYSDTSAIMIEIFALHWFRDVHVGTVRILVGNLLPPPARPYNNNHAPIGMRFVALQVRRPSGRPQGILNVGVTVLDGSMRSMPLYTLNASAVGYRHLMGEKDAYDNHNHLSPHVLAPAKPEMRRSKSDTSSMVASEAVVRHQRAVANVGKANSAITGSEVSARGTKNRKKKGKKKSKSSVLSGFSGKSEKKSPSVLSDKVLPWKIKGGKTSYAASPDNEHLEAPPLSPSHDNSNDYVDEVDDDRDHDPHSIVNSFYEIAVNEAMDEDNTNFREEQVPVNNFAYEVTASPKPQFRNSPAPAHFRNSPAPEYMTSQVPQYKNSPAPQYMSSPAPQYRNSPAPQYRNSPAPQYMNSPAPQFRNSPAPQYASSPAPQYMSSPAPKYTSSPAPQYMSSPAPQYTSSPAPKYTSSPAPQYRNSPAPQYMSSPAPQYRNSPAPQYMSSPAPQYRNSPAPQYMSSPAPQFRNSPAPQFRNSPKPEFKNSPAMVQQFRNSPAVAPQFRNSPAVSKFNPVVGYGGSRWGTPMHPFGKLNNGFEYATPRRSNLGNMGPMMMTESELGPSPSEVAASIARKPIIDEGDDSTVGGWSLDESVEGLESKLDRWRTDLPPVIDQGELSSPPTASSKASQHTRRHTDGGGGNGLFSCFSKICGVECSIVCGGDKGKKNRRKRTPSVDNASFL